jgi:DNA-binding transcriptional LysR family regulator
MGGRISLDALRYAVTVADTGSFSQAARVHSISQPALSAAVARLEETLGDRLFQRSTQGVTPTAFGARVLPFAVQAVAGMDAVAAEARRLTEPLRRAIRLGVSPLISPSLVAAVFAAVRALPGPVERGLVLREANLDELAEALHADELDLMLVPSVGPLPRCEHRIVDEEPMVVVRPTAPGAFVPPKVELADLLEDRFILVPDGCGLSRFTHQLFEARNHTLSTYPGEASGYQAIEDWVGLGLGTALLPRSKLGAAASHPLLVEDGMEVTIFYEAAWDPRSPLAADIAALADVIASSN